MRHSGGEFVSYQILPQSPADTARQPEQFTDYTELIEEIGWPAIYSQWEESLGRGEAHQPTTNIPVREPPSTSINKKPKMHARSPQLHEVEVTPRFRVNSLPDAPDSL